MPDPLPPNAGDQTDPAHIIGKTITEETGFIIKPRTQWLIITTVFSAAVAVSGLYYSLLTDVKILDERLKITNERLESIKQEQSKILEKLDK